MIPDAEREQALRERLSGLFADAPEPDPARLAAGLEAARSRRSRRLQAGRSLAWLAAASLFVVGTATAWWLAGSGPEQSAPAGTVQSDGGDEGGAEERSGIAGSDSSATAEEESDGEESPVIYQRGN